MRKPLLIAFLVLAAAFYVSADAIFFATAPGKSLTYAMLDAKGSVTGFTVNTVKNAIGTGDNMTIVMNFQSLDKKSKPEGGTASYKITISGGMITMDMREIIDAQRQASGKSEGGMEMSGNTKITIPAKLAPGVKMPDVSMKIAGSFGPMKFDGDFTISNRKCVAVETITTPAGTFECVKMTNSKVFMMGGKPKHSTVEHTWYAPGIGKVKSIIYEKDKVKESSELRSIKG